MVVVRLVPGETFDETQVYYIKCNGSNWQHRMLEPASVYKVYKFKHDVTHVELSIDEPQALVELEDAVREYIKAKAAVLFRDEPADIYEFQPFVRRDTSTAAARFKSTFFKQPVYVKVKVDGARIKTKENAPSDVELDLRRLVTGRLTATVWVNREAKTVGVSVKMPTIVDMGMGVETLPVDKSGEDDDDDSNLIADILRAEQARLEQTESRKRKREADDDGKYTK